MNANPMPSLPPLPSRPNPQAHRIQESRRFQSRPAGHRQPVQPKPQPQIQPQPQFQTQGQPQFQTQGQPQFQTQGQAQGSGYGAGPATAQPRRPRFRRIRGGLQKFAKQIGLGRLREDVVDEDPIRLTALERALDAEEAASPQQLTGGKRPHVYTPLMISFVLIVSLGLLMLFSASMIVSLYVKNQIGFYLIRQIAFTLLGFGLVAVLLRIRPNYFNHRFWVTLSMGLSFFLLIIVLIPGVGIVIQGARRWLPVPFTSSTFQPSELTKVVVVFYLSWYYSRLQRLRKAGKLKRAKNPRYQGWMDAYYDVIRPMIPISIQLGLISLQAHMSAVVIILIICVFLMATAGVRIGSWLRGGAVGVSALTLLVILGLTLSALFPAANFTQRWKHVVTRINIFTEDQSVTNEQRLQIDQALLAIGSGGVTGVGLGQSRQKYMYLPENHNDYIYSVLCEEYGFLGGAGLILLFGCYLYFGLRVGRRSRSLFARVMACGYTYLICLQAYFSMGVNLTLLPPTGISLPFFSYGGSSNLFFLIGAGLLLSVSKYEMVHELEGKPFYHRLSAGGETYVQRQA